MSEAPVRLEFRVTTFSHGKTDGIEEVVALAREPLPPDLDYQRAIVADACRRLGVDANALAGVTVDGRDGEKCTVEDLMVGLVGHLLEEHGA